MSGDGETNDQEMWSQSVGRLGFNASGDALHILAI
jgi:hypothetical protein